MRRRRDAIAGLVMLAVCVSLSPSLPTQRADASPAHPATSPQLVVTADPPHPHFTVSPGEPAYWRVTGTLDGLPEATLTLQSVTSGPLAEHPLGLTMQVQQCAAAWTAARAPVCTPGAQTVAATAPAQAGRVVDSSFRFEPLREGRPEYLLVTLSITDTAAGHSDPTLMGLTGEFGVGLTATATDGAPLPISSPGGPVGASVSPLSPLSPASPAGPRGLLALTGTTISRLVAFVAALTLLLGGGFLWAAARRERGRAR
ncbi:hypothetical protein ACFOYW_07975 [Gryllotalpicola reticulitermitis]|uniref:Uncharacterized protein n=1 Tax=Gryllotalpicola reticulitermitis TaxID=1184153 RepID=A0ABV8Q7I1_9MICO